jgi:uncharacterized repeat protein (TIGR03803 family)
MRFSTSFPWKNNTRRIEMKNLKTQLAVVLLSTLCLFTGAHGQVIPGKKASPVQSQPATSRPIVQEQDAENLPTYTVLYTFTGGADGASPYSAALIGDNEGNLYGTTYTGGDDTGCSSFGTPGCGVVFKVDGAGNEKVLYTFTGGTDGGIPFAGLIRDAKGNLYGTTSSDGSGFAGTVFKLDNTGQLTVVHSFCSATNCADGNTPYAGVIRHAGNLYGTTIGGGQFCIEYGGCGVVFRVDRTGNETVLYNFCPNGYGNCTDGMSPQSLVDDAAGNLYGTTNGGGANGVGTVFKLSPTGEETVLHSFAGGADGASPFAGLIRDEDGNLYGTTTAGGPSGQGTVFKVDPAGNETVLYSFTGGTDGGYPEAGLVRDQKGNLYGTTFFGGLAPPPCSSFCGVVFKVDTTGVETALYSFTGGADGGNPSSALTLGQAGDLYGTTSYGGDSDPSCQTGIGCGVVFKLTRR